MTKVLTPLLAVACIGATALVVMTILRTPPSPEGSTVMITADEGEGFRGGSLDTPSHDPPKLVKLPAFDLTERSGSQVTLDGLKGKAWIASFVFTRCAGPCPMITSRTAMLQMELNQKPYWDDMRLVTVTVDPDHDTPKVLAARAQLALADETHWLWLTGTRDTVWTLIRDGFKLPVNDDRENTLMPIVHSQKFVLVDGDGWIRGYYDALEEEAYQKMISDLEKIIR